MDEVARLVAIDEIKCLKARYFRGIDEKDWALFRSTLADDAVIDYRGAAVDPATGFNPMPTASEEILYGGDAAANAAIASVQGKVSVHFGHAPEIEITGPTTAAGIWPIQDIIKFLQGPVAEFIGYGHYRETYERIDGAWKIKTLKMTRLRVDIRMAQPSG